MLALATLKIAACVALMILVPVLSGVYQVWTLRDRDEAISGQVFKNYQSRR